MKNTARRPKITVSADGRGLVSQAGALLLAEALRVTGLGPGLMDGLGRWRAPRAVHDPGKIVSDLVVTLALGGDCLADVAVLQISTTQDHNNGGLYGSRGHYRAR